VLTQQRPKQWHWSPPVGLPGLLINGRLSLGVNLLIPAPNTKNAAPTPWPNLTKGDTGDSALGKSVPQREGLTSRRCKHLAISLIIHRGAVVLATGRSGRGNASGAGGTAHTRPPALTARWGSFCGTLRKPRSADARFHCACCQ